MKARAFIVVIFLLASCSVLSYSGHNIAVNGYEADGKCTQESIDRALSVLANNQRGVLRLKKNGKYYLKPNREHLFSLPSNVRIQGNGATLFIMDGSNKDTFTWDAVFFANNKENISIEHLILDSNGKNNPVAQKSMPNGASKHNGLLSAMYTDGILIKNCIIKDVKGYGGIYLGYCDNVRIEGCCFYDIGVGRSTEFIGDASAIMGVGENWIIKDNHLENSYLSNCGTGLDLACAKSLVTGNTVKSFWAGANLANNGVNESHDVVMSNNVFEDNLTGLYLWASEKPYKGGCHHNTVKDNLFVWHTKKGWAVRGIDMGFFVYGDVYDITIQENEFIAISKKPSLAESYEIAMRIGPVEKTFSGSENKWGNVRDVTINNNVIKRCSGPAIQIERTSNTIDVKNNSVSDVAFGTMPYSTKRAFVVTSASSETPPQDVSFDNNKVTKGRKVVKNTLFVHGAEVKVNGEILK